MALQTFSAIGTIATKPLTIRSKYKLGMACMSCDEGKLIREGEGLIECAERERLSRCGGLASEKRGTLEDYQKLVPYWAR